MLTNQALKDYLDFTITNLHSTSNLYRTFLIHGQSGVGKTHIVQKTCSELRIPIQPVKFITEEEIQRLIQQIKHLESSVLFFDSIDMLLDQSMIEEKEIFMMWLFDKIFENKNIIIIATTRNISKLRTMTLQSVSFEKEIQIDRPSSLDRENILKEIGMKSLKDIKEIAKETVGYLPGDLKKFIYQIIKLKGINGLNVELIRKEGERNNKEEEINTWEEVGGLTETIKKIKQYIEIPLKRPSEFLYFGIRPPKGILLYGPPGSCKTTIVRILSKQIKTKFFSLDSASIYSCYVGESEKNLRELFTTARRLGPSIIFIDEIDSIVGKREGEKENGVQERILSTLLNEMDGIENLNNVIVIGATNRIKGIDSALIRPGRFDKIIEIGFPSRNERKDIFNVCLKKVKVENINIDLILDKMEIVLNNDITGADIKNICIEAGLNAIRVGSLVLKNEHLELAIDQIKVIRSF
eukprot:GHVP01005221.1.p1 GENE.GHVP01005221.1~~GHVP01005221.1.p1  ORF type:complete len:467 (-),score=104.23 GHVP01005221.1:569-1969(-)